MVFFQSVMVCIQHGVIFFFFPHYLQYVLPGASHGPWLFIIRCLEILVSMCFSRDPHLAANVVEKAVDRLQWASLSISFKLLTEHALVGRVEGAKHTLLHVLLL